MAVTHEGLTTSEKLVLLKKEVEKMGSALVAYSGGVDSTFLLKISKDVLGDRVLAGIGKSDTYTRDEFEDAINTAARLGARYVVVETEELASAAFRENGKDRCYLCKSELFSRLKEIAERERLSSVLDGTNVDDLSDIRPGLRAGRELGVRSPLAEAGLGKDEIRKLSFQYGLETWNKPQMACLASRFPHGTEITAARLKQVEECEKFIRKLGIKELRVRYHGEIARVEVGKEEIPRFLDPGLRSAIILKLKEHGFRFVTLDLEGYRTGSMNEKQDD
ncbi:MAG: ATP-dependent sacrificial sulfur transferase LarE [Candidatus Eisenbacteria bacterium]|nr:ATP-dependent sacrificial sulfur transferase LarE [Candidatus Eisenbacteria bacterium]